MKILASILHRMDHFLLNRCRLLPLILIIIIGSASCDDEKLESSTVRFTGRILNSDFTPAGNINFKILVRTDPTFTTDTTIAVRIPASTDASGNYDLTVHTDNFPAIPFYTVVPAVDTLISLEVANCVSQNVYQKIFPNIESQMITRFGAASFLKISFIKNEQSTAISARYVSCGLLASTNVDEPNLTVVHKLPYDLLSNQYTFYYIVTYFDFTAENISRDAVLQPYDTTEVVIHY